jgi:hypothetical protein
MSLQEQLQADMIKAQKGQDKLRLSVIRLLRAAIKNQEIEKKSLLTDQEVIAAIISQVKRRKEAIEQYQAARRQDLAGKEEEEMKILQAYLPQPLSEEEVKQKIEEALQATGAQGLKDLGKVMSHLMPEISGRADGKLVNQLVRTRLS